MGLMRNKEGEERETENVLALSDLQISGNDTEMTYSFQRLHNKWTIKLRY